MGRDGGGWDGDFSLRWGERSRRMGDLAPSELDGREPDAGDGGTGGKEATVEAFSGDTSILEGAEMLGSRSCAQRHQTVNLHAATQLSQQQPRQLRFTTGSMAVDAKRKR